jgi:hypothetical protein
MPHTARSLLRHLGRTMMTPNVCRCADCERFMLEEHAYDAHRFWFFIHETRRDGNKPEWWQRVSMHLDRWQPLTIN